MATAKQLEKARKKALESPKNGKHGKRWTTLAQEKVREEYENELRKEFEPIFSIHIKAAKKEKNSKERMYAIDQLVGKAKERVELGGPNEEAIKIDVGIQSTIDKIYGSSSK